MKTDNIIQIKTYAFALKVISVYKKLTTDKREFILSKQLLRSATSIGANVEEAIGSQSKRDFIHKLSIAYKEARESNYWINLLKDSEIIEETTAKELATDITEILKIIGSIQKTLKTKMNTESIRNS